MNDETSSVRIEIEERTRTPVWSAVGSTTEPKPKRPWGPIVGLILLALLAVSIVWFSSARGGQDAVPTPTTSVPAASDEVAAPSSVSGDITERVAVQIDQRALQSITALEGELIAAATGYDELLWSSDGGATWSTDSGGSVLDQVVAVGQSNGEPRALVSRADIDGDQLRAETMVYREGQWIFDSERTPLQAASGQVREFRLGRSSLAIVEDAWDMPVPQVTEVLARQVDRSVASRTCSIRRRVISGSLTEYDLMDCDGSRIGGIDAGTFEPGSSIDDQFAFAQEVLRKRTIVYVAAPKQELQRVELPPSQLILDIAILDDGFVAFVLDSIGVLGNVDLLYSQAFTASLIRWDAETGLITQLPPPARASAWSANRVVATDDGSILVVSPVGIHRATEPFDDWELVDGGEFEPRRPGRIVNTALYGDGFFVRDPALETGMYVSCCAEDWELVDVPMTDFRRMLVASDDALVFGTVDGRIVQVDR